MAMIKAFSLLEIMVVIVIVGILATFGHLTYVGYTERAKTIEALAVLDDYQSIAMQLRTRYDTIAPYYVLFTDADQTGLLTGTPNGVTASKAVNLKYVDKVTADSGTSGGNTYILLGAQLKHDARIIDGADHVYVAGIQEPSGVFTWVCGISASKNNTVNSDYLPPTCQQALP